MRKLFQALKGQRDAEKRAKKYKDLIHKEAVIGGQLFGPIPKGHRREFFCLDVHTWVWHEEWVDNNRKYHVVTTRYDVRPHGVFKAQDGQPYQPVTQEEGKRLLQAAQMYRDRVKLELYSPQAK